MRWWPKGLRYDDVPEPVMLREPLATEVRTLLADGKRVDAVRLVRQRTHLNLLPAVRAVDAIGGASA